MMVDVNARSSKLRMSVRLAGVGLAVAALAGCGDITPDEAAVIDGQSIGESELQEATAQLNSISAEAATPSSVLGELTRTPFLDTVLDGSPAALTEQQVSELLAENGLNNPNDLTVDVARTRQYLAVLQDPEVLEDPEMSEALNRLQNITAEDIEGVVEEINPRYGDFDPETATIVSSTPEWIEPAG
ncbi:hypothetical protein BH23ACT6_BH23ACT6_01410 [soil metagenome]